MSELTQDQLYLKSCTLRIKGLRINGNSSNYLPHELESVAHELERLEAAKADIKSRLTNAEIIAVENIGKKKMTKADLEAAVKQMDQNKDRASH